MPRKEVVIVASTTFITAVESFAFVSPVGPINIRKGETFHKDAGRLEHCPAEALEKNFRPFVPNHDVETATAAPSERRRVNRAKGTEKAQAEKDGKDESKEQGEAAEAKSATAEKK
jgi:hypothetical protein